MKTIIHFGPPKTGTSAVQWWCNENASLLMKSGIYYPQHTTDKNEVSSGNLLSIFDKDANRNLKLNKEKITIVKEETIKKGAEFLLLSSEFFFLRLPELIEFFPRGKFVGYIRNPLEILDSNYNQSVKRHNNTSKIPLTKHLNCNVLNQLSGYLKKYSEINFQLRAFSLKAFHNESIISDMLDCLGISVDVAWPSIKINKSYTHSALETKRWLNRLNLHESNVKVDSTLQSFKGDTSYYTVIPDEYYMKYQSQASSVLKKFTDEFPVVNSESLLEVASNSYHFKPPYYPQEISIERFSNVIKYIKKNEPSLYKKLQQKVRQHYGPNTVEERALIFY